jgi:RHS repeat-associated protein
MRNPHSPHLRRLLCAIALIFWIALLARPAVAQDPPPDLETGLKPYGSFHGGDIDTVSLSQGGLFVQIPLLGYPQRGALSLDFDAFYSNYSYGLKSHCTKDGSCSDSFVWQGVRNTYVDDTQSMQLESGHHCAIPQFPAGNYFVTTPTIHTANGANHPTGDTGSGWWYTVDATGIRVVPGNNLTPTTITDQKGITYSSSTNSSPAKKEDANGNEITLTSGWNDTIGRTIPFPPNDVYYNTLPIAYPPTAPGVATDTSGCLGPLTASRAVLWQVPAPGAPGTTASLKFCFANAPMKFSLWSSNNNSYFQENGPWEIIQSILLPNGQSWIFEYNDSNGLAPTDPNYVNFASLTKITFPTGGTISYTWGQVQTGDTMYSRRVLTRSVDSMDGTGPHAWSYAYGGTPHAGPFPFTNTVTDPLGNYTQHTFGELYATSLFETQTNYYDKSSGTAVLLKTVNTDYNWTKPTDGTATCLNSAVNVAPSRITTVWPNGQTTKQEFDYDTGFTFKDMKPGSTATGPGSYGQVVTKREYDYGSGGAGALLRRTVTTYQGMTNSNYLTIDGVGLPASVTIYDGAGTQRAQTTYSYDGSSLVSSGITTQHDSAPPNGAYRGNQTSVSKWLNTTGSNVTSTATFYDTGMRYQTFDPLNHSTTFAYSGTFAGAYPTTVTNALSQPTNYNYDFDTGLVTSATDPNNLATSYTYDSMFRLASVTRPDGGGGTITLQESSFPSSATVNTYLNTSTTKSETDVFDGFGRVTKHQLTSDPQGIDFTDTTYDSLGRVSTVSNPHRTCGTDPTSSCGITSYAYDALNRKKSVTYPDGSVLRTAYCGASTLVTDPTKRWRRSRTDGLGRLVEVDEPNAIGATVASTGCPGTGEAIWVTNYTNDVLGNLTNVLQNGSRPRTFTYDSLSRLLTSANPEVGTLTYTYNLDGPVHTKTDARGIVTTYTYDSLHRELARTYSNSDPTVTTTYDQSTCLASGTCQNIGHRTSMTDAAGSESWSYQEANQAQFPDWPHTVVDKRTTGGITKTGTYYSDMAGNIKIFNYPTGRTIYTYMSSANRIVEVYNGPAYAAAQYPASSGCVINWICYTPQGTIYSMSLYHSTGFNGLNILETYNSRLQPQEIKVSSTGGNAMDLTYNFVDPINGGNAGHVFGITNNLDTTRSQTFTYDQVNRITTAQTTSTFATSPSHCWAETYQFDNSPTGGAWGNLTQLTQPPSSPYTGCTYEIGFSKTADANNHLSGLTYDASGNTSADGYNSYTTWNAESQLTVVGSSTYLYDGDGRRVAKANAAVPPVPNKLYWYGPHGETLGETDGSGNTLNEYVFLGSRRIALLPAGANPILYVEDQLGTARVNTSNTGVVCYDADFYPYGGERVPYTDTCTQNNYKFEGKERDGETGNDDFGARYYSNRFGRWLSADWSNVPVAVPYANLTNPQTLNLYSMVADDPESFADLDGHEDCRGNSGSYSGAGGCGSPNGPPAVSNNGDGTYTTTMVAQTPPTTPQVVTLPDGTLGTQQSVTTTTYSATYDSSNQLVAGSATTTSTTQVSTYDSKGNQVDSATLKGPQQQIVSNDPHLTQMQDAAKHWWNNGAGDALIVAGGAAATAGKAAEKVGVPKAGIVAKVGAGVAIVGAGLKAFGVTWQNMAAWGQSMNPCQGNSCVPMP